MESQKDGCGQEPIPNPQVTIRGQRSPRRQFSTAYKLQILDAYDACDNALARGALLRKEGLYHARLSTWRKQRDEGKLSLVVRGPAHIQSKCRICFCKPLI